MKYIRTKEGIYSTSELIKCEDKRFPDGWFTKSGVPLIAINQADTIKELCDEFVLPKFREVFAIDVFSKQICINHIKCGNGDVYGAIWTERGLIYVAKMNEKGELELI